MPSIRPTRRPAPPASRRAALPRAGFALESVLLLMLLFGIIIAAGLTAVNTIQRTSIVDYRSATTAYAAEGGADDVMSQLDAAMQDGVIGAEDVARIQTPDIPGFKLTTNTRTTGTPEAKTITSGPFAGLISLNQPMDIEVTARDSMRNSSTVVLSVNAQSIPLFQFGVFYEEDLEILPGAPMTFAGWVHSNSNIYLSSNNAFFESQLTTPDSVFWQRKDRNQRLGGVHINNASGTAVRLDFDSRSHPGASFVQRSTERFNNRLMTGVSGVRSLKLPLPVGMDAYTLIEPRLGGDVQMVRDVKMAWKADWYITVDVDELDDLCNGGMTHERSGPLPDQATCETIFHGEPNAFYDGREDLSPDLVTLDMGALRTWVNGDPAGRRVDILFITFVNDDPGDADRDYPALRVRNGARLPDSWSAIEAGGFSLATSHPLYVQGDYNDVNWKPAAFFADAITFLSNRWDDSQQDVYRERDASNTRVFAAIAAGHSPTSCDWQRAGCPTPVYGGGLENFPRFLEDWRNITMTYQGSLVSLFASRRSFGDWGNTVNPGFSNGRYYRPPRRDWSFDLRFRDPRLLPPGTPRVGTVIQTAFRPVYE
jgi:hypothetical protein